MADADVPPNGLELRYDAELLQTRIRAVAASAEGPGKGSGEMLGAKFFRQSLNRIIKRNI